MRFERTRRRTLVATLALLAPMLGLGPVIPAYANEVLIYSARHYGQEPAFEAFTKKTEGERTPADVLLTVDAGNLWNAARAGLLSKLDPIVAKWGTFKQDDINVASAGEFQAAATRLADRVGYK